MRPGGRVVTTAEEFFRQEGERLGVETAFVFGSRLGEATRADSDVDVAVVFAEDTEPESTFDRANDIALHLGRRLGADVDVVVLDPAFSRPMLAYNAVVRGIPVFVRDRESYLAFRNEAMRQMEDFSLFGVEWQLEVARTALEHPGHA